MFYLNLFVFASQPARLSVSEPAIYMLKMYTLYVQTHQRYRIFFPGKVCGPLTYSNLRNLIFFPAGGKKKVFFFFTEKVCSPLTQSSEIFHRKINRKCVVFYDFEISRVFFFSSESVFSSGKFYTSLTHLISKAGKTNRAGKKNSIFTHSLHFCRKVGKNKLFRGKKNTVPLDTHKNIHISWK